MLQIAICDDEQFYREKIKRLLEDYLREHDLSYEISLFMSGEEFLGKSENKVKYDIVFMDINMNEMDGIQTAMQMRAFHSETYGQLVCSIRNPVEEAVKIKGKLIPTSKRDDAQHGIGLMNVGSVITKYGGTSIIRCEDGWFFFSAMIEMNREL